MTIFGVPVTIAVAAEAAVAFVAAILFGTLVEYVVHRLMHSGKVLGKKHARHHQDGDGQGWLGEFTDYAVGSLPILWLGFLYSVPAGIGYVVGGVFYAALAAYSHQLQHEHPEMVFWLPRPVHYLHHHHRMWKHNFGILVDWWDRVFGTYRNAEFSANEKPARYPLRDYLRIRWF